MRGEFLLENIHLWKRMFPVILTTNCGPMAPLVLYSTLSIHSKTKAATTSSSFAGLLKCWYIGPTIYMNEKCVYGTAVFLLRKEGKNEIHISATCGASDGPRDNAARSYFHKGLNFTWFFFA